MISYSLHLSNKKHALTTTKKVAAASKHNLRQYESEEIKKGLENKIDMMTRHEIYSKSKTAPTEEEREKSRQEYLDRVGIHPDFRW